MDFKVLRARISGFAGTEFRRYVCGFPMLTCTDFLGYGVYFPSYGCRLTWMRVRIPPVTGSDLRGCVCGFPGLRRGFAGLWVRFRENGEHTHSC